MGEYLGALEYYKEGGGSVFLLAWEPAFADTLALFEEFEDTPEAGEGGNAKDSGNDYILHHA